MPLQIWAMVYGSLRCAWDTLHGLFAQNRHLRGTLWRGQAAPPADVSGHKLGTAEVSGAGVLYPGTVEPKS